MNLKHKAFWDIFTKLGKESFEIWLSGKEEEGEYRLFYSTGQLLKQMFVNKKGELDGEVITWARNGKLTTHSLYKNGKFIKNLG